MKLEILISKYLDGDLTHSEDMVLREMIQNQPEAREYFGSMLDTHLALKDDAYSIQVPASLMRQTEDAVLMKILAQTAQTQYAYSAPKKSKTKFYYASVAAVVAFLLINVLHISDFENNRFIAFEQSGLNVQDNNNITNITYDDNNNKIVKENLKVAKVQDDNVQSKMISFSSLSTTENISYIKEPESFIEKNTLMHNDIAIEERNEKILAHQIVSINDLSNISSDEIQNYIQLEDEFNSLRKIKEILTPRITNLNMYQGFSAISPYSDLSYTANQIQLTSIIGNELFKFGLKTAEGSSITQLSQSIAYSINDNSRIGIEFGYSEFRYDHYVKTGAGNSIHISENKGSQIEVLNPTPTSEVFIPPTLPYERSVQIFWGSAFYELNLFNWQKFNLDGRFGVGATNIGPLGFSRAMAKYELFRGFYLTTGSEIRFFMHDINPERKSEIGVTGYLIYGIQFKF